MYILFVSVAKVCMNTKRCKRLHTKVKCEDKSCRDESSRWFSLHLMLFTFDIYGSAGDKYAKEEKMHNENAKDAY